ncbi:MAG: hypothetical protein HY314_08340 [Acidobacteria bacterium]|nr:hypothetical protein [Acidobacteriota bacterium]
MVTPSLLTVVSLFVPLGAPTGAVTGTAMASSPSSPVPARTTPWAVIKCKFSDQPQEPTFDPAFITGADGMSGYWQDVSYGQISLDGSAVYGWYTLPFTLAEGQKKTRGQRIDACIAAATDVDFSQYYSVIAILNAQIDSGSAGGRVVLDPLAWFVSFAAHEMGHGYGLDHSFDDSGVVYDPGSDGRPGAYGDGWDIMSAMTFAGSNPTFAGRFGASGPGLNAPNLDKLGWLAANRVVTWDGPSQTINLAALNHPEASGYLMAKVPFDAANPNHYYTVEFRRQTGWDKGIPQDTVLIHEVRPDGLFYLIRANGGPERLPGQTFHDVTNNVAITVLNMDSTSSTATVNIGRDEVWVDFNYRGSTKLGTFDFPYTTLAEGLNTVAYGGTLKIKAGSRNETAIINKRMRIEAYGGTVTIGR